VPGFVNYKKGALDYQPQEIVYQLFAHGRWFSPASSTTKTGFHDIAEILLKVVLNIIKQSINHFRQREVICLFMLLTNKGKHSIIGRNGSEKESNTERCKSVKSETPSGKI
jgi:hypothetical protein